MDDRTQSDLALPAQRLHALDRASRVVLNAWNEFDHARERESVPNAALLELLEQPLPEVGVEVMHAIDRATAVLDASLAQSRPRYFAFIGSSGLPIGALADLLAHSYDINLAVDARAASKLEWQAIGWLASFLGFPAQMGSFTSGGTVSNITALASAREAAIPGARKHGLSGAHPTLYCSEEAHYSIKRAAEVLGIGGDQVRGIAIDSQRRMRPDVLRATLADDLAHGHRPVAIVATAGTTLTGAVDPLGALAEVAAEHRVWLHVDGAYGLPAAAVGDARTLFEGLERADSITVDCHKWMFVPKACSAVLVRDVGSLVRTFAHDEAYMPHDGENFNAVDITLEYSRPFRALKLWLAFATHGAGAFRDAIARNCAQAQLLYDLGTAEPLLEVLPNRPQLSIVPFRVRLETCPDLSAHSEALCEALQEDGRVFVSTAVIDGEIWLRPCFTNFRTRDDDVRVLVAVSLELGASCADLHG